MATSTPMLQGLGGGTGGVQLQPGQLATATTPTTIQQSGTTSLGTPVNALGSAGATQPATTLPSPTPSNNLSPTGNTTALPTGSAGTPVTLTQPGGSLIPGLTPMTPTQIMNTPQMNTASEFAAKFGTKATTPDLGAKTADKYNATFNAVKNAPPPTNGGQARDALQTALDQHAPDTKPDPLAQAADAYASMNPVVKQMFDNIQTLISSQSTRTSLVDEFTKLNTDQGLQADKLALMNINNVMKGTEDDIRNEITKAGGFATNSQVLALTAARNKVLMNQATQLQDQIQMKEDYVKQIVSLTQADYAEADKQVSEQLGLDEKVAEVQMNLDNATTSNLQSLVKNIGYDGLAAGLSGSPDSLRQAEKSLGLARGALSNQTFLSLAKQAMGTGDKALQFISGTKNQEAGVFNPNTGSFSPMGGSGGTGSGGGASTGGANGANQAYYDAFANATIGVGPQSLASVQANFDNYMKTGDLEGAKNYLTGLAIQRIPAQDKTTINGRNEALAALNDIQGLLASAKAQGIETNLLTGSLVDVSKKLGASPNTNLNYIGSRIAQALQTYRRSMTGVAFSPGEAKEYGSIFPSISNVDTLNTSLIAALRDSFNSNNRAQLATYMGGNNVYDSIFGPPNTAQLPNSGTSAFKSGDIVSGNDGTMYVIQGDGHSLLPYSTIAPSGLWGNITLK